MRAFSYARPRTVAEAMKLLAEGGRPKGAGLDLLDLAKRGVSTPAVMVDVRKVARMDPAVGLMGISGTSGSISLSPSISLAAIATDPLLTARCPALSDAAAAAATPQIRNVATLAGNLLQRPRCAYFRDPFFECRKRGGSTCPAMEGVHTEAAIFANSKCCATHPSNLATALVALRGEVMVGRTVLEDGKVEAATYRADRDLFVHPDEDPLREARVALGEVVVLVSVDAAPVSAYVEVNQKASYDWASVAAAVVLVVEGGKVNYARIALGAVAPIPIRSKDAEDALKGKSIDDEDAWAAAGEAATQGATPLPGNRHKVRQLRAVVRRAVAAAAARAKTNGGK